MDAKQIERFRGGYYSINYIVSAYNASTKDTRVYLESERLPEQALLDFLDSYGAGSVVVDSFGENWEIGSKNALISVFSCGNRDGFQMMETGTSNAVRSTNKNSSSAYRQESLAGGSSGMLRRWGRVNGIACVCFKLLNLIYCLIIFRSWVCWD